MLFGRCFENALQAYFRGNDSATIFFKEWNNHRDTVLEYSKHESWDKLYHQGIRLLERFAQDDCVKIHNPHENLQIKLLRQLP